MKSQELIVDEAGNGQGIKGLHEQIVDLLIVLVQALSSEIEELSHLSALVIASQHVNGLRVVELQ